MYYVGGYFDDTSELDGKRHFVGWSKNKLAIQMYNVAGHCTGAFYEHYVIYEYDTNDPEEFSKCVKNDWDAVVIDEYDDSYINIYETSHGDYLSITNREYNELIVESDIEYEVLTEGMRDLYMFIVKDFASLIRQKDVSIFIGYVASTYVNILKDVSKDASKITDRIDNLQAFLYRVKTTELSNFY